MLQCHRFQKAISRRVTRLREERGQALVEFGVILPVLMAIILGIIYFGRFEDYNNNATQLAELGARSASVNFDPPGTTTLDAYIFSLAQPELVSGSADVAQLKVFVYYPTGSNGAVGTMVRACVATSMTFPLPLKTPTAPIVQAATFRIEQAATNWTPDPTTAGSPAVLAGCPIS